MLREGGPGRGHNPASILSASLYTWERYNLKCKARVENSDLKERNRLISARKATKAEKKNYENEEKEKRRDAR
jgi:hypothetical protein